MIQVHKRFEEPKVLSEKGRILLQEMVEAHNAGKPRPKILREVYAHSSVKDALKSDQHFKCCFCEESFHHVSHGTVEHFRPKGAVKQSEGHKMERPGYFWLAYDWDNLFYCCQLCNEVFKKTYFPLEVPELRATSPNHDLKLENPLIISPNEDPEAHLEFVKFSIKAKGDSKRGAETIKRTGLDRLPLEEARRNYFVDKELLATFILSAEALVQRGENLELVNEFSQLAKLAVENLRTAMLPTARFSAMIRDNFSHFAQ